MAKGRAKKAPTSQIFNDNTNHLTASESDFSPDETATKVLKRTKNNTEQGNFLTNEYHFRN